MNIYVVVEGKSEKPVYRKWIQFLNSNLTYVNDIFEIRNNNFSIISGSGYPQYFKVIKNAIADVNNVGNIDRLIIAIDSEDMTCNEKYNEVYNQIKDENCIAQLYIIVQYFCLETWALGNKQVGPRNPHNSKLLVYKKTFNVLDKDPELLPSYPPEELNRSHFALKYLKLMLKEKHLTYTKTRPTALLHPTYFKEVKKRLETTGHILSFNVFLSSFI